MIRQKFRESKKNQLIKMKKKHLKNLQMIINNKVKRFNEHTGKSDVM